MKKNNLNPLDPIDQLKRAKPAKTSDARVEHLIQQSESNTSAKHRTPLSHRFKFALIAAPALLTLVAVQGLNANIDSPTLRLDLGAGSSTGLDSSLGSAVADCVSRNRPCNDVGYGGVAIPSIDWNYTILPSVTTESPDGHVFSLSNFGGEKEIASRLAIDFGIRAPIQKKIESDGFDSFTSYSAGTWEDENLSVEYSTNSTWIDYYDPAAKDWSHCQDSPGRKDNSVDCSSVAFEQMPTVSEATLYVQQFLQKLKLVSGRNLSTLIDGEYLIQITEGDSNLIASASLVLNGQPTSGGLQFYWFNGSKDLASIDGTLQRAKDEGLFKTLSAEMAVDRMKKYITLPSLEKPFTLSRNSWEGMSWAEKKLLWHDRTPNGVVEIDVEISRAEVGQVTIYDAKGRPWVVPGFHYFDDSGYLGSAFSLDSEYIQMDSSNN